MTLGTDGIVDRPIIMTVDSTDDPIPLIVCYVEGETHPRFILRSDGSILAGAGSAAPAQSAAIASLTDSSGGTAGNTIADVPGSYTEATLANQLASLTAKVNAILAVLRATGQIAT